MKRISGILIALTLVINVVNAQEGGTYKLWYNQPATNWNEALPVGNGRLGAMIYGDPVSENIQLNEETVWGGGPTNNNNPNALGALQEVRDLLFEGKNSNAQSLADKNMLAEKFHGANYQLIGNLTFEFPDHEGYTDYYRELDIENALFTSTYKVNGVTYKREVFSSFPDQVIVMRFSADADGQISFSSTIDGKLMQSLQVLNGNTLDFTGLSSDHEGVEGQVEFDTRVRFYNQGGSIDTTSTTVEIENADEVLVLISIATNFVDYQTLTADETAKCENYLAEAESKDFNQLLTSHISDYRSYFDRLEIDLGNSEYGFYPVDTRLKNFSLIKDPEMVELLYQYGRYLLISSSRPGGQPANLQGIWNSETNPPWDSKYTININTEMNYWPAEKTSLMEMHEPLVQMLRELAVTGSQTAQTMYGADGWVVHHNTDIWRTCGVVDAARYGMWPMGGAWLSQHLWEKYLYSGDSAYLASVYPILKDASRFYLSFLIEEPENHWLVVSPSMSPENIPHGKSASVCYGTTMDTQLLNDLFSKTIKASKILNQDSLLAVALDTALGKLPPMQIGEWGQLQEWMEDWDWQSDDHRHVSHLYGLHPSNQISPYYTPELFDAARTSLIYRGDVSTGWSMGWKINLWARMLDGNHAYKLITDQLTYVSPRSSSNGGTYPNLLDAHPPFQIDGNFGCTSGITEMLVQTQNGFIQLLPALPDDWKSGEIRGVRTYGGFDLDLAWEDGMIESFTLRSGIGGNCRIRVPQPVGFTDGTVPAEAEGTNSNPFFYVPVVKDPLISPSASLNAVELATTYTYDFPTEAGESYTFTRIKDPYFKNAWIPDSTNQQVWVELTELVMVQDSYTGFGVKVDDVPASVDTVVYVDSLNQLVISLEDTLQSDQEVRLTYSSGNIMSRFDRALTEFQDTIVDNLLKGSPPRLIGLESSGNGLNLLASFNKPMLIPDSLQNLSLSYDYQGTENLSLSGPEYLSGDSATLVFTLSDTVYFDYQLFFNCGEQTLISSDSGYMKPLASEPVTNKSIGLPVKLTFGQVDTTGNLIILEFDKNLALALEQEPYFLVTAGNDTIPVDDVEFMEDSISISIGRTIVWDEVVSLSYTPGDVMAIDKGKLEAFINVSLENNSTYDPVGMPDKQAVDLPRCYPNPFNESLSVDLRNEKDPRMDVWNIHGRLVYSASPEEGIHTFSTALLPPGIYIIRITAENKKSYFDKVIKY